MSPSDTSAATTLQLLGAGGFGMLLGWYLYFINRYRKGEVGLADLGTLVGVLGGGAILKLFKEGSDLFGAYGIGLFIGFFGYLLVLLIMVNRSQYFDMDWFLDGRRKWPVDGYQIPGETAPTVHPMVADKPSSTGAGPR